MTARTEPRYPFPIPFGWFQVCWPADLPVGASKALYAFDRHLVAWRDETGEAHVMDAFCPHLGAHLGHGGKVRGCELECPFHGWCFDAEGRNTSIPYADRPNRKGTIHAYPTIERNGIVMAWYHPHDEPPSWEIPEIPEFNDPATFSPMVARQFQVDACWQELAENGVDSAHFRYVHNTATVPELERYETDGLLAIMRSSQKFPTPRGVVEGRIDVDTFGPGFTVTRFSGIVDTILLGCNTPVNAEQCDLRFSFTVRKMGNDGLTSTVGDAFVAEVSRQVQEDKPIWEHKAHLLRPALALNDGPFLKFRKWAAQFYAEGIDGAEREVFPPPFWPGRLEDAPAKATASARLGHDA